MANSWATHQHEWLVNQCGIATIRLIDQKMLPGVGSRIGQGF